MEQPLITIDPRDNLAVALTDLSAGTEVQLNGHTFRLVTDVRAKHKVATEAFSAGREAIMYGVLVGKTRCAIAQGEAVTTENLAHQSAKVSGKTETTHWQAPDVSRWATRTFMGYPRPDGQVGTANVWLFVPLVFCENRNIDILREVISLLERLNTA